MKSENDPESKKIHTCEFPIDPCYENNKLFNRVEITTEEIESCESEFYFKNFTPYRQHVYMKQLDNNEYDYLVYNPNLYGYEKQVYDLFVIDLFRLKQKVKLFNKETNDFILKKHSTRNVVAFYIPLVWENNIQTFVFAFSEEMLRMGSPIEVNFDLLRSEDCLRDYSDKEIKDIKEKRIIELIDISKRDTVVCGINDVKNGKHPYNDRMNLIEYIRNKGDCIKNIISSPEPIIE